MFLEALLNAPFYCPVTWTTRFPGCLKRVLSCILPDMEKRPMLVEVPLYIRAYDVDAMGYESNLAYARWMEDLRHHLLDLNYPFAEMMKDKLSPVIARTEVDYLKPLRIHDKPVGRCWMEELGATKWKLAFEIVQGEVLHCRALQTGYLLNLETGRPAKFPDFFCGAFHSALKGAGDTAHL